MKKLKKFLSGLLAASVMLTVPMTASAQWTVSFSWDAVDPSMLPAVSDDIAEEEVVEAPEEASPRLVPKAKSFSTSLKPVITAEPGPDGILIDWDYISGVDYYRVYRYNESTKKYAKIGDSSAFESSFYDTNIKAGTKYSYKMKAFNSKGKSTQLSDAASSAVSILTPPLTVGVTSSKIKLSWLKNKNADGYEVWYFKSKISAKDKGYSSYTTTISGTEYSTYTYLDKSDEVQYKDSSFKKLKDTSSTSFAIKRDSNYNYYFKLRAYTVKDGKKTYSAFTDVKRSGTAEALMNGAKGSAKTSVSLVSYRSDVASGTLTYSEADKKIMDDFAKEHFNSKMSAYDKAEYLSKYIHYNVKYAETNEDWNKISGVSPTKAIFELHTGQCYQYNAAFTLFLAYLGFDVRLIASYRESVYGGNRISHYWGEITLDGKKFILDAGNTNTSLYYFAVPYENEPGNYVRA